MLRIVAGAARWAGPLSVALCVALVVSNGRAFEHGPGVPTAGRPEGWTLIWLCLGLALAGHAVSVIANAVWFARAWKRRTRLGGGAYARIAYHLLIALPLFFWMFGPFAH